MNETQKRRLLLVLIALSCVPMLLVVSPPAHVTASTVTLYLSTVTGYLGMMLLLWMYALGARSIFGLWFRDIAPIMKIHRTLGTYGAIAILLHPLLVLYSYGESLLYPFIPYIGSAFERHVTLGRIAFLVFATVWLSSALLRGRMAYRPWKYIHYLAYLCLPFALLHVPGTGSQYLSHTSVKAYFFSIVLAYFAVSLIRVRGFINSDKHTYTIARHDQIAPDTNLLALHPNDTYSKPKAGQYVYIKLGFMSEEHPFSVVASNEEDGTIILAYRSIGRFTKFLAQQDIGKKIHVSNPFGEFLEPYDQSSPTVFIAGGIGITPFVQAILSPNAHDDTWLFYANRTHASSILTERLKSARGSRTVNIYSDEVELQAGDARGYFDTAILQKYLADPTAYTYYVCGPQGFMEAAKSALSSLSVPAARIKTEAFNF